jgi:hypothetical protein
MKYLTYLTSIAPHFLLGILLFFCFIVAAVLAIWA